VAELPERKGCIPAIERHLRSAVAGVFQRVFDKPVRKAAFVFDVFVCRENLVKLGGLPVSMRGLNHGVSEGAFVRSSQQGY
jgi:hypothetical protein